MSESADKTTENLVGCGLAFLLMPFMLVMRGWVLATLWRWLVVPTFELQPLTGWQALGVSTVVGVFTMRVPQKDDETALEGTIRALLYGLIGYALSLAIGYVVAGNIGGR